jgi:hypothetical protein
MSEGKWKGSESDGRVMRLDGDIFSNHFINI